MTLGGGGNLEPDRRARTARSEMARQVVGPAGSRMSYLVAPHRAAGPTVLLIHGSGVSAGYWVNQLLGLGRALRVVAIDLPGHGASDPIEGASIEAYAEATAQFLQLLGASPVIVAGHSLGGAVAIALAARHPDAVAGLVLLSSCAKLPPVDNSWERWLPYLPGALRKVLFFSMAKKILFAPGSSSRAVSLGMQELRSCRPETILQDVLAARTMDLTDQATRLKVPALLLCGSRDRLTPPALSEQLGVLIPRARLRTIEGAGHMLLLEEPERVNQEILAFARSILAPIEMPSVGAEEGRRGRPLARRLLDWVRSVWSGMAVRETGSRPGGCGEEPTPPSGVRLAEEAATSGGRPAPTAPGRVATRPRGDGRP
jgi:pimeloyl-ACP methyl ester carboxylesterase